MANEVCKAHSGIVAKIETLEANVQKIWENWNSLQKMIIGIFVALSLNLIGIIFVLLRTYMK